MEGQGKETHFGKVDKNRAETIVGGNTLLYCSTQSVPAFMDFVKLEALMDNVLRRKFAELDKVALGEEIRKVVRRNSCDAVEKLRIGVEGVRPIDFLFAHIVLLETRFEHSEPCQDPGEIPVLSLEKVTEGFDNKV